MNIGVILQARLSSQRLPGKVLRVIANGQPLLAYTLERLAHCQSLKTVIVATSDDSSDDPIEQFCRAHGVNCFRGSLNDVAGRFVAAADQYALDVCVRVNGDSPLIDQHLIDYGVTVFRSGNFDLVTNVFPRSYPKGLSVEVMRVLALHHAYSLMMDDDDREHVTRYFYQHAQFFRIQNFSFARDCSDQQLSVDTTADFKLFETLVSLMDKPHWQYGVEDILALVAHAKGSVK